ncbi:MAG TPA: bacillithiol biosynthesis cysteine-adding enzyme BshC [Bacteroidota bacterium]|nr:bacillithiol biosynthesis cysteine-adding enzyme BshC [Bacteroidota bacterium]
MKWINTDQLQRSESGFSALYVDYLNNYERVSRFFAGSFTAVADWKRTIEQATARTLDRATLVRVLHEQNRALHCGVRTLANIDLLDNQNTVAVVTGQQLGLFSGPLYTMYKTITVLKLAEKLTADFPGYNFVPVFWLEGEDHDFDEINYVTVLNAQNELQEFKYFVGGQPFDKNPGATGAISVDETIEPLFQSLSAALTPTEFTESVLGMLRGYYKPGATMMEAFSGLMHRLFEETGLVLLNANAPELKQIMKPVFRKEIETESDTSKLIISKSVELEDHYHAQIKPKPLNLFMFHKGGRFSLEPSENDYYLKGTRQRFTRDELMAAIDATPELFSPNVALRPICQDLILPTVAYIGGPGEIAYFAQLKPVFEKFDIPMPIIYPRATATILEEKINKVLEKYSLTMPELMGDLDSVLQRISEQVAEVKVEDLFSMMNGKIHAAITEGSFGIQQIDPTLKAVVDSTMQKFDQTLKGLKEKTQKAQQQKQEVSLKQIRKAAATLFPNENFQEREFTVLQFMNKYGTDFMKWLMTEIVIDRFEHQVLQL